MESLLVPPKLLLQLALLLLLFAPLQQLQARQFGVSTQAQHVSVPLLVLVLPTSGGGGSDDDDGAAVPPKLNALPGVSRPGGQAPPAPKPGYPPHPMHEPSQDVASSSPGVTGKQTPAPPSPAGNPPSHYRRSGPATDLLCVFWDALVRAVRLLPEQN